MADAPTKAPESPYAGFTPRERVGATATATPAANATPPPEVMAEFLKKTQEPAAPSDTVRVVDESGQIREEKKSEVAFTKATLDKVAKFLDPTSRGPITLLVARHKVFALRIPVQQEILDVTAVVGNDAGERLNAAQAQWSILGELQKAAMGYVAEGSAAAQVLRANIAWPDKWPVLNKLHWTDSRDPYIMTEEILPLWEQYVKWRIEVTPTRDEIDFYWANQG